MASLREINLPLTAMERRLLPGVNENEWQATVLKLARRARPGGIPWRAWHFNDSRRQAGGKFVGDVDAKGYPDTTLVHPMAGVIFAELKRQKGYSWKDGQREALDALAKAPGVYATWWRPSDIDVVEAILFELDFSTATWWPESAPAGWPRAA